jgi:DNA-binding CsgD family transcriptional regulator
MAQLAAARGDLGEASRQLDLARHIIGPTAAPGLSLEITAPLASAAAHVALAESDDESALHALRVAIVNRDIARLPFVGSEAVLMAARALSALAPETGTWDELISDAAARVLPVGPLGTAWRSEVACRLADRRGERDCSAWARVVAAWRAVGHVYYRAIAQLSYAESLVRVGDREAAATEILEGLGAAESLGALPLAEQFRKLARSARIKLEDTAPTSAASPADYLTSREREVLGLVALGRTNAQIAAELFMSPKTASVHVSRIITKLGVSNRTEAAAYAHRRGFAEG